MRPGPAGSDDGSGRPAAAGLAGQLVVGASLAGDTLLAALQPLWSLCVVTRYVALRLLGYHVAPPGRRWQPDQADGASRAAGASSDAGGQEGDGHIAAFLDALDQVRSEWVESHAS